MADFAHRSQLSRVFAVALMLGVVAASHYVAHRQPCPASADELNREILLESPTVSFTSGGGLQLEAYIHNKSKRALEGVAVVASLPGDDQLQAEAINHELGAPSLSSAPILPGAWRAVRFDFNGAASANAVPPLRVVSCLCY